MKFIVDHTLGKLAKELRMLGYDTRYYRGNDPRHLIQMAGQEGRVVLTRSTKLLPRVPEIQIVTVTEDNPFLQLRALIRDGYLSLDLETLFSRCLLCNSLLEEISPSEAEGMVPDFIFYHQKEFFRCPQCQKIFWKGSHQESMQKRVERLFCPAEQKSSLRGNEG